MTVASADTYRVNQITYADLYKRWERGNWSAYEIDFGPDRESWAKLSDLQQKAAMWIYAMFFYGEDAVAHTLSPYIDAAPTEEQKYFLATQQADEARHAILFHRFFNEVVGISPSVPEALRYTEDYLFWGYRGVLDRLERMADELRADRSAPKFAQAITLYQLLLEAGIAQPGQHYSEDFSTKGELTGMTEGIKYVARDEHRHVGFGVKVLSELVAGPEGEEVKAAIGELMREMMPYVAGVFVPPNWDRAYTRVWDVELEDVFAYAIRSLETKWRLIGYPLHEMPADVHPFDPEMPHQERAERQAKLLEAGVLGDPDHTISATPEIQRYFFDLIAQSAVSDAVDGPMTVQWKFRDAPPWYVRIDNGSRAAVQGEAPDADVVLRTSFDQWVDIVRGEDLRKAIVMRKVRPSGSPRKLLSIQRLWPAK
jgi:hypothetical protein